MGFGNHLYRIHEKCHHAWSITATAGEQRTKMLMKKTNIFLNVHFFNVN